MQPVHTTPAPHPTAVAIRNGAPVAAFDRQPYTALSAADRARLAIVLIQRRPRDPIAPDTRR